MKTIAVTIDEETLELLDAMTSRSDRRASRSALVRRAVRELAELERRRREEESDGAVLRRNRGRLRKEAEALVRDQAEP